MPNQSPAFNKSNQRRRAHSLRCASFQGTNRWNLRRALEIIQQVGGHSKNLIEERLPRNFKPGQNI